MEPIDLLTLANRISALEKMSQLYYNQSAANDKVYLQVQDMAARVGLLEKNVQNLIAKIGLKA